MYHHPQAGRHAYLPTRPPTSLQALSVSVRAGSSSSIESSSSSDESRIFNNLYKPLTRVSFRPGLDQRGDFMFGFTLTYKWADHNHPPTTGPMEPHPEDGMLRRAIRDYRQLKLPGTIPTAKTMRIVSPTRVFIGYRLRHQPFSNILSTRCYWSSSLNHQPLCSVAETYKVECIHVHKLIDAGSDTGLDFPWPWSYVTDLLEAYRFDYTEHAETVRRDRYGEGLPPNSILNRISGGSGPITPLGPRSDDRKITQAIFPNNQSHHTTTASNESSTLRRPDVANGATTSNYNKSLESRKRRFSDTSESSGSRYTVEDESSTSGTKSGLLFPKKQRLDEIDGRTSPTGSTGAHKPDQEHTITQSDCEKLRLVASETGQSREIQHSGCNASGEPQKSLPQPTSSDFVRAKSYSTNDVDSPHSNIQTHEPTASSIIHNAQTPQTPPPRPPQLTPPPLPPAPPAKTPDIEGAPEISMTSGEPQAPKDPIDHLNAITDASNCLRAEVVRLQEEIRAARLELSEERARRILAEKAVQEVRSVICNIK